MIAPIIYLGIIILSTYVAVVGHGYIVALAVIVAGIALFALQLSFAKIPSALNSLAFFCGRVKTSTHYEETTKTILDYIFAIQKDLQSRSGEPRASPAASHHEALEQAAPNSSLRPSLLDLALPSQEQLANAFGGCHT